jgi:formylglycine-generating enzyme required for sulfatase activity
MEYAPFGLPGSAWAGVNGDVKPVWVIRNGLNDTAQNAQTDFAEYDYNDTTYNPNGALNVAVVDPAAPLVPGLYEGNNPAPIAGTEGKAGAELDAWIATYGSSQSPPVAVATTADMQTAAGRGKYGVYTRTDTYTITFKDGDGKVIQEGPWDYNATPSYTGPTPAKAATTVPYTFTWTWNSATPWNPAIAAATENTVYTARFVSSIPDNMAFVAGGTFTMGSPTGEAIGFNGETQHEVTVSSFYMGKYEVTQKEYLDTMTNWTGTPTPSDTYGEGDDYPAYYVTWLEAVKYCNKRSENENLTPAYTVEADGTTVTWDKSASGYRLPTEAEWEYACRAGTTTAYNWGTDAIDGAQANYFDSGAGNKTVIVGSYTPNAWDLYDMHGNVWEWCWDWYAAYESGPLTNPDGAVSGTKRVVRGGSWDINVEFLRSACRVSYSPSVRAYGIGFRLVRPGE